MDVFTYFVLIYSNPTDQPKPRFVLLLCKTVAPCEEWICNWTVVVELNVCMRIHLATRDLRMRNRCEVDSSKIVRTWYWGGSMYCIVISRAQLLEWWHHQSSTARTLLHCHSDSPVAESSSSCDVGVKSAVSSFYPPDSLPLLPRVSQQLCT